jgi:hypothetical protein
MLEVTRLKKECKEIRHLFWEFYARNHLWFYLGSGAEECGYKPLQILPSRVRGLIDFNFELTAEKFLTKVKDALEFSIRSEMKYVIGSKMEYWFFDAINDDVDTPSKLKRYYFNYLKDNKIDKNRSPKKASIEWGRIAFNWGGWNDSYCGPAWIEACDIFLQAGNLKFLKDKVIWIDKCLDLYHNNGRLLNKTSFTVLESAGDLNLRFCVRDWVNMAMTNKEISLRIRIDNEISKADFQTRQQLFPISRLTHNLILKNKNRI